MTNADNTLATMLTALQEVEQWADDCADVDDGRPNDAMRMLGIVRPAITAAIEAMDRKSPVSDALTQIIVVCDDNAPASCNQAMALKFVRDVAAKALSSRRGGPAPGEWQMVPVQPTQKMCDAARQSWMCDQGPRSSPLWGSEAADIYRAMLKASPTFPSGQSTSADE